MSTRSSCNFAKQLMDLFFTFNGCINREACSFLDKMLKLKAVNLSSQGMCYRKVVVYAIMWNT